MMRKNTAANKTWYLHKQVVLSNPARRGTLGDPAKKMERVEYRALHNVNRFTASGSDAAFVVVRAAGHGDMPLDDAHIFASPYPEEPDCDMIATLGDLDDRVRGDRAYVGIDGGYPLGHATVYLPTLPVAVSVEAADGARSCH